MPNLFLQSLGGDVSWEGELAMDTLLTLPNGIRPTLAGLIGLTNGDALEMFAPYLVPVNKFDESEARDEQGRWTTGGSSDSHPYELKPNRRANTSSYVEANRAGSMRDALGDNNVPLTLISRSNADGFSYNGYDTQLLMVAAGSIEDSEAPYDDLRTIITESKDYPQLPFSTEQLDAAIQAQYGNLSANDTFSTVDRWRQDEIIGRLFSEMPTEARDAYLAKENAYVRGAMENLKLDNGQTVGSALSDIADKGLSQLRDLAADPVQLTMPSARLGKFISDGEYKNAFQVTSPDKGVARTAYLDKRLNTETNVIGVPANTADAERPIYATLGSNTSSFATYGDSTVTLKDSVKDRSTITIGDSMDGTSRQDGGALWLSDVAAGKVSTEQFFNAVGRGQQVINLSGFQTGGGGTYYSGYDATKTYDVKELGVYQYVETQIHNGLSLSDVASITAPEGKIAAGKLKTLDSLGIKVN